MQVRSECSECTLPGAPRLDQSAAKWRFIFRFLMCVQFFLQSTTITIITIINIIFTVTVMICQHLKMLQIDTAASSRTPKSCQFENTQHLQFFFFCIRASKDGGLGEGRALWAGNDIIVTSPIGNWWGLLGKVRGQVKWQAGGREAELRGRSALGLVTTRVWAILD